MPRRVALLVALAAVGEAAADTEQRPAIDFYRWQEDWSVLADPQLANEPGDALKYISLADDDPKRYLSFGLTLRERFESNNAPLFGVDGTPARSYLLHRLELHADAHLTDTTRIFVQVENALAPGLKQPGPADANKLDLRLAFLDTSGEAGDGIWKFRIGRQEIAFDLQRFVSVRDGPNVRQAYDAIWGAYETAEWRFTGFASQPVQYRNDRPFDDYSNRHLRYDGVRAQRKLLGNSELALTYSVFRDDGVRFPAAAGNELRRNWDVHYTGNAHSFDWDVENMLQYGSLGDKTIRAWAAGSLTGYTFPQLCWTPRIGLQVDGASGDRNPSGNQLGTFNPLFPNGYYVTLSGYTGYTNFIHVKPSLTLSPAPNLKVLTALGVLWRQTTQDAIYMQPDRPLPGSAGEPGKRSATYLQLRADWTLTRTFTLALETDRYEIAEAIRRLGGHDAQYFGAEMRWGW
jgi:hypothetical protein